MATHFNLTLSSWKSKYTHFSNGSYKRGLQCKYSGMFDDASEDAGISIHLAVSVRHEEADPGDAVHPPGAPLLPVLGDQGGAPHAPRLLAPHQPLEPGGGQAAPGAALRPHRLPDLVRGPRT